MVLTHLIFFFLNGASGLNLEPGYVTGADAIITAITGTDALVTAVSATDAAVTEIQGTDG